MLFTLYMVLEERPPGWRRRSPPAQHVLTHAGFADVDTQLQQLAVDPRRAPEWVLSVQGADQSADLLRYHGPSRLSPSNLPRPEQAKAFPVPADDRRRLDQEETGPPVVPDLA